MQRSCRGGSAAEHAVHELDGIARALAAAVGQLSAPPPGQRTAGQALREWVGQHLLLVLRWLATASSAEAELSPGSWWLRGAPGADEVQHEQAVQAAERLPSAVLSLAEELRQTLWPDGPPPDAPPVAKNRVEDSSRTRAIPAPHHEQKEGGAGGDALHRTLSAGSRSTLPDTRKGTMRSSQAAAARPRGPPGSGRKGRPPPALESKAVDIAFQERKEWLTRMCGTIIMFVSRIRRYQLLRLKMVLRDFLSAVQGGAAEPALPNPVPVPAQWDHPPYSAPLYPQLAWPVDHALEPMPPPPQAGLQVSAWGQVGDPYFDHQADCSQWEDFTVRVHIAAAPPQQATPQRYSRMRLSVKSLETARVTSVRTSLGDEALSFAAVRTGQTVRMIPSLAGGSTASYFGVVVRKDQDSVLVRWLEPKRGGPPLEVISGEDAARRETVEMRDWFDGRGRALRVREKVLPPFPEGEGNGGLELSMPDLEAGQIRDCLVIGQVRTVGLTELTFHLGARPWEQEDKRRLRHNIASCIGEDPAEVRFADMSEVGEDGCVAIQVAFPSHQHPRLMQRRLLMLAEESAEESGLAVPLTGARPAYQPSPDIRCTVHFRFSDADALERAQLEKSGLDRSAAEKSQLERSQQDKFGLESTRSQGSLASFVGKAAGGSKENTPRPRVVFDPAHDVAHSVSADCFLAERGGVGSGRVREEVFRHNLCTVIKQRGSGKENAQMIQDLTKILSSPMYDHPCSELRETRLFLELLWSSVDSPVDLGDKGEWDAMCESLRQQSYVINPAPRDPHPIKRHMLYATSGSEALCQLRDACLRMHGECMRMSFHEEQAEEAAIFEDERLAAAEEELGARKAVEAAERQARQQLVQMRGTRRSVSPSPCRPPPGRSPPRRRPVPQAAPHAPPRSHAVGAVPRLSLSSATHCRLPSHPPPHPSPSTIPSPATIASALQGCGSPKSLGPHLTRQLVQNSGGSAVRRSVTHNYRRAPAQPRRRGRSRGGSRSCSRTRGGSRDGPCHGSSGGLDTVLLHPRHPSASARAPARHAAEPPLRGGSVEPSLANGGPLLTPHAHQNGGSAHPSARSSVAVLAGPHPRQGTPLVRCSGPPVVHTGNGAARSPSPPLRAAQLTSGLVEGGRAQVVCGKGHVASLCKASVAGWHESQARYVGRSGHVVSINHERGTAVMRFTNKGMATHDPGRPTEWPLAALIAGRPNEQLSESSRSSADASARSGAVSPLRQRWMDAVHTSERWASPGGSGRARAAASPQRRPRAKQPAPERITHRSRGARLGAIYAAPAAAVALMVVCSSARLPTLSSPKAAQRPGSPASELSSVTSIHLKEQHHPDTPEMLHPGVAKTGSPPSA